MTAGFSTGCQMCSDDGAQVFQFINRCVRQSFLCDKDRRAKKNSSQWTHEIKAGLTDLAVNFSINDVPAVAVFSHRLQVIERMRPDVLKMGADEDQERWFSWLSPQSRYRNDPRPFLPAPDR
jgi:hypothetical protein